MGLSCGCVSWGLPNLSNLPCNKRYLTDLTFGQRTVYNGTIGQRAIGQAELFVKGTVNEGTFRQENGCSQILILDIGDAFKICLFSY